MSRTYTSTVSLPLTVHSTFLCFRSILLLYEAQLVTFKGSFLFCVLSDSQPEFPIFCGAIEIFSMQNIYAQVYGIQCSVYKVNTSEHCVRRSDLVLYHSFYHCTFEK